MAAVFTWKEDNGAATGSPVHGTTRTDGVTEANHKNADDTGTAYSAAPIATGANSYEKFIYGHFASGFNLISSGLFAHTAGALGTGLTLKGTVTSVYTTPATAANAALTTDMTSVTAIGAGLAVLFATTGPESASPTSTLAAPGFSQYCVSQMQVGAGAAPGDTTAGTFTMQYNES